MYNQVGTESVTIIKSINGLLLYKSVCIQYISQTMFKPYSMYPQYYIGKTSSKIL